MSISIMKADKMNLDLRATILDILRGIELSRKRDSKSKEDARTHIQGAMKELQELRARHSMLESLARFYDVRPNLLQQIRELLDKIETTKSKKAREEVEKGLSKVLIELEDKFSERVQKGVLAR